MSKVNEQKINKKCSTSSGFFFISAVIRAIFQVKNIFAVADSNELINILMMMSSRNDNVFDRVIPLKYTSNAHSVNQQEITGKQII